MFSLLESDYFLFIPIIIYLAVYFLALKPRNVRSPERVAVGCTEADCLYFPAEFGKKCSINPEHFDENKVSANACDQSQANLSTKEMEIQKLVRSGRYEVYRNVISILTILATIGAALIKKGS